MELQQKQIEMKIVVENYVKFLNSLGESPATHIALIKVQESVWWAIKHIEEGQKNAPAPTPAQ